METPFVFIDTTEFVSASFNFDSAKLVNLREKADNGSITIITTDIVYREVIHKIGVYADEAYRKVQKLIQGEEFRTLRHLLPEVTSRIAEIDFEKLKEVSKQKFDDYLEKAQVEVLSTNNVRSENVLELYFGKQPPFGDGKKKDEFPDAITLVALREWCAESSQKIYLVSKDNDIKKVGQLSTAFLIAESLEQFLQTVTQHEQNTADFEAFIKLFNFTYRKDVESEIVRIASEHEIISSRFDEYVEFHDFEIKSVDLVSSYLIFVDSKEVSLSIVADVTFSAVAHFRDYSDAPYDKEDGVYLDWDDREEEIEDSVRLEGTIDYRIIRFPPQDWADIEFEQASLAPDPIDIDLEDILFE